MGEARQRRSADPIIYHHTSTLRTNQLWMSGEILPEGQMPPAIHPQLGEIRTDALLRRPMVDFPAVVWLTDEIGVPRCLTNTALRFVRPETGEGLGQIDLGEDVANAIALHRMALGFRPSDIGAVRWPDYRGYSTEEGRALNETAREVGDDPDRWWISETAVDILKAVEIRGSRSIAKPKMERIPSYLDDVHRMVRQCRSQPGVYIPPTWLSEQGAKLLATRLKIPMQSADDRAAAGGDGGRAS